MSRPERISGLYDWVLKHNPISLNQLIAIVMRDFEVSEVTARGYVDSILAGQKGKPTIILYFGVIQVKDAK
jgi:hypothetical protein